MAARSVSYLFSLYFVYLEYLLISLFGFKSWICILIAPVPVHCFSITFRKERDCTICVAKTKALISCAVS